MLPRSLLTSPTCHRCSSLLLRNGNSHLLPGYWTGSNCIRDMGAHIWVFLLLLFLSILNCWSPPVSLEAASEQRPSLSGSIPCAHHQACVWHTGYTQSVFEWKNGWTHFLSEGMNGHSVQTENFPRTFLIALCERVFFPFVIKLQGELQQRILWPQCPPGPVGERRLAWYEASWTGRW